VDADKYLLQLVRYIHLNPVRAGIVADPDQYHWSAHRTYLGLQTTPWLTTDFTLRLFGRDTHGARKAYRLFVLAGVGMAPDRELAQGRSDEPRILGNDHFLSGIKIHWRPQDCCPVEVLIERICRQHAIEPAELARQGRHRKPARIRALITHHALERRITTASELARRFGRSLSTLCETLEHYRRTEAALFNEPIDLS
jgi:hypothetical protein